MEIGQVHVYEKNFSRKIQFSLHTKKLQMSKIFRLTKTFDVNYNSLEVIELKYNCFQKRLIWICCLQIHFSVKSNISKRKKMQILMQVVIKILTVPFCSFQLMKNKVLEDLSLNLLNMNRSLMKYRNEIHFAFQRIQLVTYSHVNQVRIR